MTREEIQKQVLDCKANYILAEMATGVGKSKIALDKLMQWYNPNSKILIVIPRVVLIKNWLNEIHKWGYDDITNNITFSTYVSIPKQDTKWDIVIFDEVHHLSQRCINSVRLWKIKNSILLSATIKHDLRYIIQGIFKGINIIKVKVQDAISNEVLPEPTIILFPLHLQNTRATHTIWKNPKGKTPVIETNWTTRWSYWKQKVYKVKTYCTQEQYYDDLCDTIDWYKRKAMSGNKIFKNQWLHKCGERLKWLSDEKFNTTKLILDHFRAYDKRILVFSASIEQSENFGCSINSKSGTTYLNAFNEGKTNHISAVGMLDEGCNLVDCQIGIFNMLNSSNRLATQRIGRILRHPNPVILIPYYKDTREEEIIKDMLEGYSSDLIIVAKTIKDIDDYLKIDHLTSINYLNIN